jgi:hypothetical protein
MRKYIVILTAEWLGLFIPLVPAACGRQVAPEKVERGAAEKPANAKSSLRMTPGVVCRSIDGYENYEPLPEAAQTSEEKLLVYFRPMGFQSKLVDGLYQAHLVPDFQIRKRGAKAVLRQKLKIFEYKPRSAEPPRLLYMKSTISLKELPPGDYDLILILHDEIAKGAPATQVVKFRIIPAVDPRKTEKPSQPAADN